MYHHNFASYVFLLLMSFICLPEVCISYAGVVIIFTVIIKKNALNRNLLNFDCNPFLQIRLLFWVTYKLLRTRLQGRLWLICIEHPPMPRTLITRCSPHWRNFWKLSTHSDTQLDRKSLTLRRSSVRLLLLLLLCCCWCLSLFISSSHFFSRPSLCLLFVFVIYCYCATTSPKRPPNQNPDWFLRQSNRY